MNDRNESFKTLPSRTTTTKKIRIDVVLIVLVVLLQFVRETASVLLSKI